MKQIVAPVRAAFFDPQPVAMDPLLHVLLVPLSRLCLRLLAGPTQTHPKPADVIRVLPHPEHFRDDVGLTLARPKVRGVPVGPRSLE